MAPSILDEDVWSVRFAKRDFMNHLHRCIQESGLGSGEKSHKEVECYWEQGSE